MRGLIATSTNYNLGAMRLPALHDPPTGNPDSMRKAVSARLTIRRRRSPFAQPNPISPGSPSSGLVRSCSTPSSQNLPNQPWLFFWSGVAETNYWLEGSLKS
jgi:hypothetical protein